MESRVSSQTDYFPMPLQTRIVRTMRNPDSVQNSKLSARFCAFLLPRTCAERDKEYRVRYLELFCAQIPFDSLHDGFHAHCSPLIHCCRRGSLFDSTLSSGQGSSGGAFGRVFPRWSKGLSKPCCHEAPSKFLWGEQRM